ncbi:hypothetical protein C900_03754 [Fulvivirga imtechensis AK7]|uniref:Peptidase C-terminal archaeal/bacterial domain-containing protein n=1 Tax=Fulvivirga imtechensis AK7 TaxID=1237149 RepID=L8JNJ0_9BACT|nr:hypothetical protein [Fulvivirga imtechensis]ELR70400.1 hypothetical protein C900_03754 [Fulvivirga imtechensis AK7]
MKKAIYSIFVVGLFFLLSGTANGQCNPEQFTDACIPKLASGFNFLKSYKIDGQGGAKNKVEYSYVFTKGTQYMINVCATGESTDGIVVSLFDSNRNQVASSKLNGQYISAIAYPCNTTGIYYIQYTFDNSAQFCGGSALGFKR